MKNIKIYDQLDVHLSIPSLGELKDVINEVLRHLAEGNYENPPKQALHTHKDSFFHAMPAYLPKMGENGIAGTKMVSVYPHNVENGMKATTGYMSMLDIETGLPSYLMDATLITDIRTALVSSVSIDKICNVIDPNILIIGAGASADSHIEVLSHFYPGSQIILNSRKLSSCEDLCNKYLDEKIGIEMDLAKATKNADVIIICTSKLSNPIMKREWLSKGQLVLNVHSLAWDKDVEKIADLIFCDNWEQVNDKTNGLTKYYTDMFCDDELCNIHKKVFEEDIVFVFNYGLAVFDIAIANKIKEKIEENYNDL